MEIVNKALKKIEKMTDDQTRQILKEIIQKDPDEFAEHYIYYNF